MQTSNAGIKRELQRMGKSEFEIRVLLAAKSIPRGKTVSYGQLARMAGHPGAARAAGTVMKKNPFAPTIPCHRVIRSDGSLGNYSSGGTKVKARMLKAEGAIK